MFDEFEGLVEGIVEEAVAVGAAGADFVFHGEDGIGRVLMEVIGQKDRVHAHAFAVIEEIFVASTILIMPFGFSPIMYCLETISSSV